MSRYTWCFGVVVTFLALAVASNWLTAAYGLVPVGFGLTATAGTWCAGLVLLARDLVHDIAGRTTVLLAIVAGAGISATLAGPRLAVASGVAFAFSEAADLLVYQPLRRTGWGRAAFASGIVGSAVDTVLFLELAGFPVQQATPGQMFAKTVATATVVIAVVVGRAVLRHRVRAESA